MKHTVELKQELFKLFKKDKQICELLNITENSTVEEINRKIKRQFEADDILDDKLPLFFIFTFIPSIGETWNYLVNKNLLEFRIYGRYQSKVDKLYLAIKRVLQDNYEDSRVITEGSFATGNQNLVGYLFRIRPLTWS